MGKSRTPAWLSKLKQVGEALKVQKGNQSPSYISSPRDSSSGNGDESPASAFIRRSCEAPELARSLSLRRAKARAAAETGGRSTDIDGGSPLPSTSTSGHRLSRSIDALYALSQKREEEGLAAAGGGGNHPPSSPGHNNRDLDQATMALLASSLSRTKVARQKELAERAARAAQELKARGARAAASDDSTASSDRVALSFNARASSSSNNSNRRKSASDLPRSNWTPDRLRRRSVQDFDSDSISQQQRYGDAGPSSLCTSEDDRPGDSHLNLAIHARTTSMSCSEDAWDNSSRHSRMTGSEDAWEGGAGSWGSDLFAKLRALKQLYSHEGKGEAGEEEDESEAAAAVAAGSDFMEDDGWGTSDEASGGEEEEEDDYLRSPGQGWATPSRTTPSRRQQMEASPSRSFVGAREMASPSRRKVGTPPTRREEVYHYDNFEAEKVQWKGDSDGDKKFGTRRRGGGYDAEQQCQHQQQSNKQNLSCFLPNDVSGVVRESVAMVKYSQDPYVDFRHSMLEMILEKDIHQPADLEELLHCYLTLNSPRQYHLIKKAFFDTWNELLSRRSKTFWGAV